MTDTLLSEQKPRMNAAHACRSESKLPPAVDWGTRWRSARCWLRLEDVTKPSAYYIHEEEIPRAGVRVLQSFQRTRWINGEVFVWLGMKKKTGRGEGSSGLAFDQIKNV